MKTPIAGGVLYFTVLALCAPTPVMGQDYVTQKSTLVCADRELIEYIDKGLGYDFDAKSLLVTKAVEKGACRYLPKGTKVSTTGSSRKGSSIVMMRVVGNPVPFYGDENDVKYEPATSGRRQGIFTNGVRP